jgi:hypothetical protein
VGIWFALFDFAELTRKVTTFTSQQFPAAFANAAGTLDRYAQMSPEERLGFAEQIRTGLNADLAEVLAWLQKRFLRIEDWYYCRRHLP